MKLIIDTRKILELIAKGIVSRTKSGKDINNVSFKPYTPSYAKKKRSSKVDLTLTGHMLNSLKPIDNDTLGFDNSFASIKASGNENKGRQFMGISKDQQIDIQKQLDRQLELQLRKELLTWNTRSLTK